MINTRQLRRYLSTKIGFRIIVIYFGSRNRIEKYDGILFKTYDNVFSIKLCNGIIKCFSYGDILTKTIRIYI